MARAVTPDDEEAKQQNTQEGEAASAKRKDFPKQEKEEEEDMQGLSAEKLSSASKDTKKKNKKKSVAENKKEEEEDGRRRGGGGGDQGSEGRRKRGMTEREEEDGEEEEEVQEKASRPNDMDGGGSRRRREEEKEEEDLDFEDPFGDEFEEEEEEDHPKRLQGGTSQSESEEEEEGGEDDENDKASSFSSSPSSKATAATNAAPVRPWRPGIDELGSDEELDYDPSAYEMLHRATLEWSCLSFDILQPHSSGVSTLAMPGSSSSSGACPPLPHLAAKPPYTAYVVGGTQAETSSANRLFVMKWSNLHKTNKDSKDSEDESEDSDDDSVEGEEEDPRLDFRVIAHQGTVNRIRCCPQMPRLVATWSDLGEACMWDIEKQLQRLDDPGAEGPAPSPHQPPKFKYKGHGVEGYAMDWNPLHTGKFLTGDIEGGVCLWEPCEGGWEISKIMSSSSPPRKKSGQSARRNLSSKEEHRFEGVSSGATVEETQWKLTGSGAGDVFATASSDGGVRIYDCRSGSKAPSLALLHAHPSDVNALRWSPVHGDLLLTGDEDGCAKVWDERYGEMPLVVMHWHKKPITSADWHPTDEATFVTASLDNSVALWDMSVEVDEGDTRENDHSNKNKTGGSALPSTGGVGGEDEKMPEQLMFLHLGQDHISEVKFHPLIPGAVISTACDGFNFFRTCNI